MLTSQDVYNEYWGEPDRLPGSWKTIDEIAKTHDVPVDIVENLFSSITLARRLRPLQAHRVVWDFLTNECGLKYKIDFDYMTHIGMSPVLYELINYGIGINLNPNMEYYESQEKHNGNYIIFTLPSCRDDIIVTGLNNFFKKYKVQKRPVEVPSEY